VPRVDLHGVVREVEEGTMDRRKNLLALSALSALPFGAVAQQRPRVARIGYLAGDLTRGVPFVSALVEGLRELGYAEGQNIAIEYRDAKGHADRLPALAAEFVALKVDLIFAPGSQQVIAAMRVTQTIPIVFADVGDPVALGFVASLARPGGNVTGLANLNPDLIGKWFELLKEAAPQTSRIALLWEPGAVPEEYERTVLRRAEAAAQALRVGLRLAPARRAEDIEPAFADMARARVDGLVVWANVMLIAERARIIELADKYRIAAMYQMGAFVDNGGLMSYSPNVPANFRRAALYVDKILRGARPAELPVEQSNRFELVINKKTATALGMTIAPSLLSRADRLVE
jgi:putative ABC transport system substrate-binding protein